MSQTDGKPSETVVSVDNYLRMLQECHDGYPDCCPLHVQYRVAAEHRHALESGQFPLSDQ
jgi:hypothetical protein